MFFLLAYLFWAVLPLELLARTSTMIAQTTKTEKLVLKRVNDIHRDYSPNHHSVFTVGNKPTVTAFIFFAVNSKPSVPRLILKNC